jgi:hypothetical protein
MDFIDGFHDVSLTEVMTPNFNPDYKRLPCIILQVKKNESKLLSVYQQGRARSFFSGTTQSSSNYDRLILFGYRSSSIGKCFATLYHSSEASKAFFENFQGLNKLVGVSGYFLEPRFDGKTLTQDSNLPLIDSELSFYPFQFEENIHVPLLPTNMPVGETQFFQLIGVRVLAESLTVHTSKCSGVQCDRLLLPTSSSHCCCFQQKGGVSNPPFVLSATIIAQNMEVDEELLKVKFQSWSFTKLCLVISNDMALSCYSKGNLFQFRAAVSQLIHFVNQNGGWDICGWGRRGKIIDAADQSDAGRHRASEDIASDHVNPHIINMVPHNTTEGVQAGIEARKYQGH